MHSNLLNKSVEPLLIVVCVLLAACSGDSSSQPGRSSNSRATNPPAGAFHMQQVAITDPSGFGQPMTAATLLIPVGWKPHGGIVWQINNRGCGRNGTHFAWAASTPDGTSTVEILPEETWSGSSNGAHNQGQCPNVWLTNAREYLAAYVENNRSSANVRSYRDRPDIAQKFQHLNQSSSFAGGDSKTWVDAGEVLLDYSYNDKPMEEVIALLITFQLNRVQGVYPGSMQQYLTMTTAPGFSMRAPAGKLNLKLAEAVRLSGRPDPEWSRQMAQHRAKMSGIALKGAKDRHNIRMQTQREIAAIHNESYNRQQKARDEGNRKFNQMIREVETFQEPDTHTRVELPDTHKNAWKLNDGTYVLTDQADFEPYRDLGIDGSQLKREG